MLQHTLVGLIFAACLWHVIRRIARSIKRVRNNDPCCLTCTDTACPLRERLSDPTLKAPYKRDINCKRDNKVHKQDSINIHKHKK